VSDITLTLVPWAPGTSVGAYPRRSEQLRPDGPPTGIPATDTQIVAADASLTYDLADGEYWAAAPVNGSDHWQYVSFVAETPFDDEGHALAAAQSENGHWHEVMVDDIGRLSTVDLGPVQPPHGPPPYATLGDLDGVDVRLDAVETGSVRNSTASDPLNTGQILHGSATYDVRTDGIPNVAAVGNLDFGISTGDVVANDTSSKNRFQFASYIENTLNQPSVGVFAMGKGKHVWGINEVAYTFAADHVAIGNELDYGNVGNVATALTGDHALPITTMTVADTTGAANTGIVASGGRFWRYTGKTATTFTGLTFESGTNSGTVAGGTAVFASIGGTATGLLIVAEGGNVAGSPPGPYIQLHANTASQAQVGIKIHNSGQPAVIPTGNLIQAAGESCAIGIGFVGSKFTAAAIQVPVDSGSTTASHGLQVRAQGGFDNGGAGIYMDAVDATSRMKYGLRFHLAGSNQPVQPTGVLLFADGGSYANGLDFSAATFSTAAIKMGAGHNMVLDTVTGTKFGTATTQKIGFYNKAPVVQPVAITAPTAPSATYVQAEAAAMKTAVDAIRTTLQNLGLTA
jgi:hypothetical protein